MVEERTFGEYVKTILDDIYKETVEAISYEGKEYPFPMTLVLGDEDLRHLPLEEEWDQELFDNYGKRMVKEAVLMSLMTLPDFGGVAPTDPLFRLVTSLCANYYVRGYLLGLLNINPPLEVRLDSDTAHVVEQIDENIRQAMEDIDPTEVGREEI